MEEKKAPGEYTFRNLFSRSNVTDASELILPDNSYSNGAFIQLFAYCVKLVEPPKLSTTTLSMYCYAGMFYDCSSLINAPELPATTLAKGCYNNMFHYCEKLTRIKVAFGKNDKWPSDGCTDGWLINASNEGTFSWAGSDTPEFERSDSTIPDGWTIEHAG